MDMIDVCAKGTIMAHAITCCLKKEFNETCAKP
jgi:hypothetical protein